ncbi:T6SS immunity protein Tdi1 domain-containing protein [Methylomonas rhizoryzae]|uniref:T6SS immunity protein Tdi1 domain-containing protein n=1 Tax=Methylomonas rhizoryzae TaxID=2608981 RepID=UPI001231CE65|nr:T6SS immunity protein Tdi1 domain-containing protein [Methylomonas rhizoryzae]
MSIIQEIKESWSWAGIEPQEVVGENDFGNLMIKDVHGRYWHLCPEDVYCKVVANNRAELDVLSTNQDFLADWYMSSLVEQAKEKCGALTDGRKYYLVLPGVLGGKYDASNINTAPLIEIIRLSGDIGRQIEELPDGAQIQLKVVE